MLSLFSAKSRAALRPLQHNVEWVHYRSSKTKKASSSSKTGKGLMRFQCDLMIEYLLGINVEHIAGKDNHIPDYISRYKQTHNKICDFNHLQEKFPELTCCRRFQPSQELLLDLYNIMLNGCITGPLRQRKQLGQLLAEKDISVNSA